LTLTRPDGATRIVILGGGFAGAYCAQALGREARRGVVDVTLIDRHDYFAFTPLLFEAGIGALEPRHAVVPLRDFTRSTTFRMAEVTGVDFERREVRIGLLGEDVGRTVPYDHLVIALGSVTRLPDIPGLREHGLELKSLRDAIALRDRAIQMLEVADALDDPERRQTLLHFVVVGANFNGVEVAGELEGLVREAGHRYPGVRASDSRVTLVEITDRILRALDPDLSDYAMRRMRARGIEVLLETTVKEIRRDTVRLSDDRVLAARTVIWCGGIAPNPLLEQLRLPTDDRGYLLCEPDMRVRGRDDVWAIGDCAVNPGADGIPYPPTAQHAVQQGRALAHNLVLAARGKPTPPARVRTRGELVALGCRTGVARVFGVKLSGFLAWFLWRTVYLFKMPGFARKIRVALDWTVSLLFSQDYVQLGVHRTDEPPKGVSGS